MPVNSRTSSSSSLDDLASQSVVASKHWPASSICFDQIELNLRAHDFVTAFVRVDAPI